MKDFDLQVKFDIFVVSMATWTIEYNLKISLLLSLQKIHPLDFPINLHSAYYNYSQTKSSVPPKILSVNWLFEKWIR